MIIDGRKNRQAVLNTGNVIVSAVSRRDVNLAGAGVQSHEIGKNHA